jgi:peptidoglycan/LPS O-acetylase OafA/YrhL
MYAEYTAYLANCGVNLFFVLSGFLITQILIRSRNSGTNRVTLLKVFYTRRFLRIFPLYYFVILFAVTFNLPGARENIGYLLSYLANFRKVISPASLGSLSHVWSLAVEEQFYIIFPFLIYFVPVKYFKRLFIILIIMSFVSRILSYAFIKDKISAEVGAYALTPCCFDCFGIGALLGYLNIFKIDKLRKLLNLGWAFMLGLIASIFCYIYSLKHENTIIPGTCIRLFFAIFCFWFIGKAGIITFKGVFGKVLDNPVLLYLGKISYGIYIYHYLMVYLFDKFPVPHERIVYFLVTISIASLSWFLLERPINNLKKYFEYVPIVPVSGIRLES